MQKADRHAAKTNMSHYVLAATQPPPSLVSCHALLTFPPHCSTCPDLQVHPMPILCLTGWWFEPLWKILVNMGWLFPMYIMYGKIKKVPNHQPVKIDLAETFCFSYFSALVSCQFMAHELNCGGPNSRLTASCVFQQLLVWACNVFKVPFQSLFQAYKIDWNQISSTRMGWFLDTTSCWYSSTNHSGHGPRSDHIYPNHLKQYPNEKCPYHSTSHMQCSATHGPAELPLAAPKRPPSRASVKYVQKCSNMSSLRHLEMIVHVPFKSTYPPHFLSHSDTCWHLLDLFDFFDCWVVRIQETPQASAASGSSAEQATAAACTSNTIFDDLSWHGMALCSISII